MWCGINRVERCVCALLALKGVGVVINRSEGFEGCGCELIVLKGADENLSF